jgi:hypothetical protein
MKFTSTLIAVLAVVGPVLAAPVAEAAPLTAYGQYASYGKRVESGCSSNTKRSLTNSMNVGTYGAVPVPSPAPAPAKYASYGSYPKLPSYTTYKRMVGDFVKNIFG